jgi:hypothetical protein
MTHTKLELGRNTDLEVCGRTVHIETQHILPRHAVESTTWQDGQCIDRIQASYPEDTATPGVIQRAVDLLHQHSIRRANTRGIKPELTAVQAHELFLSLRKTDAPRAALLLQRAVELEPGNRVYCANLRHLRRLA